MKCKACGNDVAMYQKALDAINDQYMQENEVEDLCLTCYNVAKETYGGYNINYKVREKLLEKYCQSSTWMTEDEEYYISQIEQGELLILEES